MKKKEKIILIAGIILLLFLLAIGTIIILHIIAAKDYTLVITDIKNRKISCKHEQVDYISTLGYDAPKELVEYTEKVQEATNNKEYYIELGYALIIGINGNIIDESELESGDKIYVVDTNMGDSIRRRYFEKCQIY